MGKTVVIEREQSTTDSIKNSEMPYLELTICPSYGSAYKDDVLETYGMSKSEYRRGGHYSPTTNETNTDRRLVFNEITYNASELFYRIVFHVNDNIQHKFVVDFEKSHTLQHTDITTKYWPNFGRCYSVRPKDHVIKLGINGIDISARNDIYIYFGHPGQFMYNTKTKVLVF